MIDDCVENVGHCCQWKLFSNYESNYPLTVLSASLSSVVDCVLNVVCRPIYRREYSMDRQVTADGWGPKDRPTSRAGMCQLGHNDGVLRGGRVNVVGQANE